MYDFVEGRFFKAPHIPTAVDVNDRRLIYESMVDTLAKIHAVDIDKASCTLKQRIFMCLI